MQQKETLSAFVDGRETEQAFIDELCNDPALKQQWANYHAIRSVMHGDEILLGNDFSAKMEALLENEEIEMQETPKSKGKLLKLKRWATPILQAGIAASVCFVTVLGVNMMNGNNEIAQADQPVLKTQPFSHSLQPVSYNAPKSDISTQEQLEQQQRKVNDILQNSLSIKDKGVGAVTLSEEQKEKAKTSALDHAHPSLEDH